MMGRIAASRARTATVLFVALLTALLTSLAPWFATSAAAQSGWVSARNAQDQMAASARVNTWLSGGRGYISGTLCDIAEDGRSARAYIRFSNGRTEEVNVKGLGNCVPFNYNSGATGDVRVTVHTVSQWRYSYVHQYGMGEGYFSFYR